MTKARISLILELMEMFLFFQIGLSLVIAAVVWVILESISGFDPSSDMIAPKYLKRFTGSSFWLLIWMLVVKPSELLVITLVFFCTNFHAVFSGGVVQFVNQIH